MSSNNVTSALGRGLFPAGGIHARGLAKHLSLIRTHFDCRDGLAPYDIAARVPHARVLHARVAGLLNEQRALTG
ncbi:hypothetical protein GCM10023238_33560 [Streptomyces heliomycini]